MNDRSARNPIDLDRRGQRVHLIGIGGAGMSAIAEVLVALGHIVSGSDEQASATTDRLSELGVRVAIGHDPQHVDAVDYVGVSTAIASDNPEMRRAAELGIPVGHRYDLLAAIGAVRSTLSISGTHGKTTTSALAVVALTAAGFDPSFIVGARIAGVDAAARWTEGEWLVLEADESDSTFLAPPRAGAVVTNIEADHLDHHGSFEGLVAAFERFVDGTEGPVVVCFDDAHAAALAGRSPLVVTYGTTAGAGYLITDVRSGRGGVTWSVTSPAGVRTDLGVPLPGMHLVRNATAAFALAVELGAEPPAVARGIAGYRGVSRRYEHRGTAAGVTFIDDYAHLPTEVRAVVGAASSGDWRRVVSVFQPHRYSRTASVWPDYATAFDGSDVVVVTEVYAAGEDPVEGVSGRLIVDAIAAARPELDVRWLPQRDQLVDGVLDLLQEGDLCLTMGAGDLTTLPDVLVASLADRAGPDRGSET